MFKSIFAAIAIFIAGIFGGHHTSAVMSQPAAVASAAPTFSPSTSQSAAALSNATPDNSVTHDPEASPTVTPPVPAVANTTATGVSEEELTAKLANLSNSLQLLVSNSVKTPQLITTFTGNTIPPNLTSPLTAADIPTNITASNYLSLGGGTLTGALLNSSTASSSFLGALGIGTTSPSDIFAVNGPIYLADISPSATANRLYSNGGSLYWAGSLVGGGSVGNWTTSGGNVYRASGNVGIGTTSPSQSLSVHGNGYFTGSIFADLSGASVTLDTSAASSRTLAQRAADVVNVKDFGATCDGTTDDATAINNAINYARSLIAAGFGVDIVLPDGNCFVRSTINLTNIRSESLTVDGSGGIITGHTSGTPVIDAIETRWLRIQNLTVVGDSTGAPNIGLQIGRPDPNTVADLNTFDDMSFNGNFTFTSVYNLGSETTNWNKVDFRNAYPSASSYDLVEDGMNHWNAQSAFVTMSFPVDTPASFNENVFINCEFLENGGGTPIWMANTSRHTFTGSYVGNTAGAYGVILYEPDIVKGYTAGTSTNEFANFGIHFETSSLSSVFFVTGNNSQPRLDGFSYSDFSPSATSTILAADTGITKVTMNDADIDIENGHNTLKLVDQPSKWLIDGNVYVGASSIYNLTNFTGQLNIAGTITHYDRQLQVGNATDINSFTTLTDVSTNQFTLNKIASSGAPTIDLNPLALDGLSGATVRLFRTTNTTGGASFQVYEGDGSASINSDFRSNGNSFLNAVAGNVGIGTSSPQQLLHLWGSSADLRIQNSASSSAFTDLIDVSGSQVQLNKTAQSAVGGVDIDMNPLPLDGASGALVRLFRTTNTTGGAALQIFEGNNSASVNDAVSGNGNTYFNALVGNVGIGTPTPAYTLDIVPPASSGANVNAIRVFNNSTQAIGNAVSILLQDSNSQALGSKIQSVTESIIGGSRQSGLAFFTSYQSASSSPLERLRISGTGNVGIGTTTPYSRLTVWGPDSASSTLAFNVVNSASTTVFAVFDGGNAQLSGTLTQSSDQRLKTNIQSLDASSSLSLIDALNPVTFNWIDPSQGSNTQVGFIAQQVQAIFPELVSTTSATALTPGGTLGLNYIDLIAPAISSIQALYTDVQSLEQTVAGFADNFVSAHITVTTLDVGTVTVNTGLCAKQSDGTAVCITSDQLAALLASQGSGSNQSTSGVQQSPAATSSLPESVTQNSASTTPPTITINGDNPAYINVGDTYSDLGATVSDTGQGQAGDTNLGLKYFLNGALVSNIVLDTSAVATDTIDYVATDTWGNAATSTRMVIVEVAPSTDATTSAATSTSQ
jgi:hypothetical protein